MRRVVARRHPVHRDGGQAERLESLTSFAGTRLEPWWATAGEQVCGASVSPSNQLQCNAFGKQLRGNDGVFRGNQNTGIQSCRRTVRVHQAFLQIRTSFRGLSLSERTDSWWLGGLPYTRGLTRRCRYFGQLRSFVHSLPSVYAVLWSFLIPRPSPPNRELYPRLQWTEWIRSRNLILLWRVVSRRWKGWGCPRARRRSNTGGVGSMRSIRRAIWWWRLPGPHHAS